MEAIVNEYPSLAGLKLEQCCIELITEMNKLFNSLKLIQIFSVVNVLGMLAYYMNSFNKALAAYSDQIRKLSALENNYSTAWLDNLKNGIPLKSYKVENPKYVR